MIRGLGSQSNIYQNNSNNKINSFEKSDEQKLERLESIKKSIENGEYQVNLDKLAKKMAKELF